MARIQHCLIIGGGIAGPALALFLRKAGLSASVFEAYPAADTVGAGLALAPNGMNVLAELGLAEALQARGTLMLTNIFLDERGRMLGCFSNGGRKFGQPATGFMRPALNALLRDEMRRRGLAITYEKRLTGIDDGGGDRPIIARFEDGTTATGDLLIGADGVRSRVRELILPDGPRPEFTGLIGVGGAALIVGSEDVRAARFTYGPAGFVGYCGGAPGEQMWWSNLPRDREFSRQELAALSSDQLKREMLERYGSYHAPIPQLISTTKKVMALNIHDLQTLPSWRRGRVLLIGDAAHAVSPNAGQGASLALEDAMFLAKLLRDCDGNIENAFRAFEDQRRGRAEKVVAEGRRRGVDKTIVSPLRSRIRNFVMAVLLRCVGERSLRWLYEYKIDWGVPGAERHS